MRELTDMGNLKLLLVDTWAYYGQVLGDSQLILMAEDLSGKPIKELRWALETWRKTPPEKGHKPRPPMPCELLALLAPTQDLRAEADGIAGSILSAIGRVGYMRSKQAEQELGPNAWQVVKLRGGWLSLCETTTHDNLHVVHAQLRDVAKSVLGTRSALLSHEERQIAQKSARALPDRQPVQAFIAKVTETMPSF